ncbi:MAG: hypothetical protein NW217_00610 [Hyphomicrobiaceae bacterium]|nr:hypothetical protein [Hyphomicrobiaceae bacterium]
MAARLAEQPVPSQEPEPLRVAVRPSAPVRVADREQLLPEHSPWALKVFVPRGPETLLLRDQADASPTEDMAKMPVRARVAIVFFM